MHSLLIRLTRLKDFVVHLTYLLIYLQLKPGKLTTFQPESLTLDNFTSVELM